MKLSAFLIRAFKTLLPSPFTLAVLLTGLIFLMALLMTDPAPDKGAHILQLADHWSHGVWSLLEFGAQMMLMLVLGHVLALSKPVDRLLNGTMVFCRDSGSAAFTVTLITVLLALLNWALGLIAGALLARKVGELASRKLIPINYPLIGAAGYSGLMVWHGGFSGNAPLKAAISGHEFDAISGGAIPLDQTMFSTMNLVLAATLVLALPLLMYVLAKNGPTEIPKLKPKKVRAQKTESQYPAEKLDHSRYLSLITGVIILFVAGKQAWEHPEFARLGFIGINWLNLLFAGLCLVFHKNFAAFLAAVEEAIGGASGILIQFPIYAGIMGIMSGSGLAAEISDWFVSISGPSSFFIFTLLSAGLVNFFVPSGGGQWVVQGGIVLQAAQDLGLDYGKTVMALSYGDQLTNMMQPFWALPLLAITGLKAQQILPYTLILLLAGLFLFSGVLLIF